MNKAVELMTAWGNFDAQHPNAGLDDFCRHYLTQTARTKPDQWNAPVTIDFALMRLTGRIVKLLSIYSSIAAEGTGIKSTDEFSLMNAVQGLKEPRKTEAIYTSLFELSTGTDMLNRLKKIGYIAEKEDTTDKRSKRVELTVKGKKALASCRKRIDQLAEMLFFDLSDDDKRICIQLLSGVESKFSRIWQSHKGKRFDEIYNEVIREAKKIKD